MRWESRWTALLLTGWLWLAFVSTGRAALPSEVRVRLFEAHPGVQSMEVRGRLRLLAPVSQSLKGERFLILRQPGGLLIREANSSRTLFKAQRFRLKPETATVTLFPKDTKLKTARAYEGTLDFEAKAGELVVWNRLPAQAYVATVIGSETQPNWPLEALKAQAVLTQSRLARYQPDDALGDSTQQEAFLGAAYHRSNTNQAVAAVWGQTLTYQGRTVTPYYHASCAGQTSDGAFFASAQAMPWLTSVRCPYCANAPFAKPTVSYISLNAFQRALPGTSPVILKWDSANRPLRVQTGQGIISGYQFWIRLGQRFGWGKVPGTRFQLKPEGDRIRLTSTGAGHGVGLCQWGASAMARQGKSYREILKFYFPKVTLSR